MTGVSGVSEASGAGGASAESQWADQKIEAGGKGDNGWRVESAKSSPPSQDAATSVLNNMVTRMSIEMVKQQNPTQNKFAINDDE